MSSGVYIPGGAQTDLAERAETLVVLLRSSWRPGGRPTVTPAGGQFWVDSPPRITGWGHRTAPIRLAEKAADIRMVHDAALQVTDRAGEYQVPGVRNVAISNIGGSYTTAINFVVGV